ncbi:MAG TPA: IS110 family transposase [Pseudonocardia sp.]|jgi:transposase|nr:IS110 family transposase [Pseudonocardia sp.]
MALFVGDDWAEGHHDVEILDAQGKRLARARLVEGMAGMTRLHELIAEHLGDDAVDSETGMLAAGQVVVGIETDRGPWVAALLAAGYEVFAINPMSVARYRERHSTSGAKSDAADAHVLAEIVRLDRDHHRPVAGDSPEVEGLKLVARTHQTLIWDRTRHLLRLRSALREYFPAALEAIAAARLELGDLDALELLDRAPDPDRAARLSRSKITGVLKRARRRDPEARAEQIQAVLRAPALRQPAAIESAYATIVGTQVRLLAGVIAQIPALEEVLGQGFGQHPDAELYTSQPGLG